MALYQTNTDISVNKQELFDLLNADIQTNMGMVPVLDYLDMKAYEKGFNGYEELYLEGCRIDGYEKISPELIEEWRALYVKMKINLPDGSVIELSEESYKAVANYVRKKDRLEYAKSVLVNNLSCNDSRMENLENYIISDESRLNAFAEALYGKLESDQGEKEYFAVDELIEKAQIAIYRIISNKGTENEQEDEAVLPKELAEKLSGLGNVVIISTEGDRLNSAYIDEVLYSSWL